MELARFPPKVRTDQRNVWTQEPGNGLNDDAPATNRTFRNREDFFRKRAMHAITSALFGATSHVEKIPKSVISIPVSSCNISFSGNPRFWNSEILRYLAQYVTSALASATPHLPPPRLQGQINSRPKEGPTFPLSPPPLQDTVMRPYLLILVCVTTLTSSVNAEPIFNSVTGNYYEYIQVNGGINWTDALNAASNRTFDPGNGSQSTGYLATITSAVENQFIVDFVLPAGSGPGGGGPQGQPNAWLGASDSDAEGEWFWVTGPEAGTQFWSGDEDGVVVGGMFNDWETGEPNNLLGEDFLRIESNGGFPTGWNDAGSFISGNADGYIVEFTGVAVPEASTVVVTTFGFVGFIGCRWLRRRRQFENGSGQPNDDAPCSN